jgi:hypothetical protein
VISSLKVCYSYSSMVSDESTLKQEIDAHQVHDTSETSSHDVLRSEPLMISFTFPESPPRGSIPLNPESLLRGISQSVFGSRRRLSSSIFINSPT